MKKVKKDKSNFMRIFILLMVIFIFFVLVVVLMARRIPKNVPITNEAFIIEMENRGYKVKEINNSTHTHSHVLKGYFATKKTERGNHIQFVFFSFKSNADARNAFFNIYNSLKKNNVQTFEFKNRSGLFGNTQYYIELSQGNGYVTDMFSVDNTLIVAQSNEFPMTESTHFFKAIEYNY